MTPKWAIMGGLKSRVGVAAFDIPHQSSLPEVVPFCRFLLLNGPLLGPNDPRENINNINTVPIVFKMARVVKFVFDDQ